MKYEQHDTGRPSMTPGLCPEVGSLGRIQGLGFVYPDCLESRAKRKPVSQRVQVVSVQALWSQVFLNPKP